MRVRTRGLPLIAVYVAVLVLAVVIRVAGEAVTGGRYLRAVLARALAALVRPQDAGLALRATLRARVGRLVVEVPLEALALRGDLLAHQAGAHRAVPRTAATGSAPARALLARSRRPVPVVALVALAVVGFRLSGAEPVESVRSAAAVLVPEAPEARQAPRSVRRAARAAFLARAPAAFRAICVPLCGALVVAVRALAREVRRGLPVRTAAGEAMRGVQARAAGARTGEALRPIGLRVEPWRTGALARRDSR